MALIVKELKKYYGVGSPCRTLLYCLRLAALYYFFTSPTIFLISGFLGGFTTYSSFILDFLKLAHSSQSYALLHLAAHLFGGITACRLGMFIGKGLLT
ncbi:fluoride efflux transporter FluC [Brevundimonas vesicularis]|uniref:fluoride efflux transporter FluC n=1 Tax=Brevundimonas vesicularis TaxID=41276 RepID=UPI0015EF2592